MAEEKKRVTDRELLIRIDERLNSLKEFTEDKLDSILGEAVKTNGRVTKLEGFQNRAKGAWAMLLIVAAASGTVAALIVNYIKG